MYTSEVCTSLLGGGGVKFMFLNVYLDVYLGIYLDEQPSLIHLTLSYLTPIQVR